MSGESQGTLAKAREVNLNEQQYGTFAEIGAGQEVARFFFLAGKASQTVAKTISAYDMTFSDEIYGKSDRYVSKKRVLKMLDHEYELLEGRLKAKRGGNTCFFAFANTVTTQTPLEDISGHGWMGVRFQLHPGGPTNDLLVHVQLRDRSRLQQQEALGIIGVNLVHAAFHALKSPTELLRSINDEIKNRLEIDFVEAQGPDVAHLDNRILSLEAIRLGLTHAAFFDPKGQVILGSDAFFRKPVMIQRGTFRPITLINEEIQQRALEQMAQNLPKDSAPPIGLFEISTQNLGRQGNIDLHDFIERIDTITACGHHVMISDFALFFELRKYFRRCTDAPVALAVGASHLEYLFEESHYQKLTGGILSAFSQLCDENTRLLVFPYKSEEICATASTFNPEPHLRHLFRYLYDNGWISDIAGCDEVNTSLHSSHVRDFLATGSPQWEGLVPLAARDIIKKKKLFGYRPT